MPGAEDDSARRLILRCTTCLDLRTGVRFQGEGWLTDRYRYGTCRFHRDEDSWVCEPMVFVDLGWDMPGVQHSSAQEQAAAAPVWGSDAEP